MSKLQQKPIYGDRAIQIQWMNLIYNSHGMICGCDNPRQHLQDLLELDDKKMPPFNYRYRWRRRPPWRRRYRWFQRRRPRRTFQRFYRRRYWVRRKKLFKNYKKN